jgi:septal ring factor EnvC (AmiA/AmiB activator)
MRKIRLLCAILLVLLSFTLWSDTTKADTQKNKRKKAKLTAINREINEIESKLNKINTEEKSLLNDIYKIELQYEKAVIENNKVKLQLRDTESEIKKKNSEKSHLEIEIQKSKQNLVKILRILYKLGGNSYLKLFIRIDSLDQLFKNYRLFIALISYKSDELNKLKINVNRLNIVKAELQTNHLELKQLQKLKEQKVQRIRKLKRSKLNIIKKINNDRKNYIKLREELQIEAQRLNELIQGKPITKRPLKTLDLKKIRGRLRWPIRGKVISSFGKKRSTRFNTYIINNGIKIRPSGTPNVHAVYPGEVVFADYFKGYGNLVIIQHSKHFHSLYGYCDKVFKEVGEYVREGEIISEAGDSGSTSGKALYFEIRTQSEARDPIRWLKRRR